MFTSLVHSSLLQRARWVGIAGLCLGLSAGSMAADSPAKAPDAKPVTTSAKAASPAAAKAPTKTAAALAPEETLLISVRAGKRLSLVRTDPQGVCKGYLGSVGQGWIAYPDPKIAGDDYQAVSSPDGKHVALLSSRSGALNLWLLSDDARQWQALTDDDGGIMSAEQAVDPVLAFSPNSKKLALLRRGTLWVTDLDDPQPLALGSANGVRALAWSPDSRWLAYVAGNSLRKIEATGVSDQLLVADRVDEAAVAWHPDMKKATLFFMSHGLCRVDDDRRIDLLVPSASHPNDLAILGGGKQAACLAPSATGEDQVVLATLGDKGVTQVQVTQEGAGSVAVSSAGKNATIYFMRNGQPWRCELDGQKARPLSISKAATLNIGMLPPLKGVCN